MAGDQGFLNETATGWATILVPPTLVRALDRFIAEEAPGMSRPEALRRALQDWCCGMGYLPPAHGDPDGPGRPTSI
jgi:hypothetical protein